MFRDAILQIVERFARTGSTGDGQVKVTCIPNNKTSLIEQNGEDGRSILLDEYHVDGKVFWAAYSGRSETIYISAAGNG